MNFLHFEVAEDAAGAPVVLGRGSMGVTYKARDRNLDCPVALKVIAPGLVADRVTRERFLREARTAAALRHPNVATVLFLGEHDGGVFYAMEYVEGRTLEEEIRSNGPMPPAVVRGVGIEVARALAAAQKAGLVHRDIKPSNILLTTRDGGLAVKLVDFGLAKLLGGEFTGETLAAASAAGFQGTPHFASPEQINGEEAGIASDIYSLGVTLFAMLTGRVPFEGSLAQVLSKHLGMEPPLETIPEEAAAFRPVLARMLAKNPLDRYLQAGELRAALESLDFSTPATDDPHATMVAAPAAGWQRGSEVAGCRMDGGVTILTHTTIHHGTMISDGRPAGVVALSPPAFGSPDPAGALESLRGLPGLISCRIPDGWPGVAITDRIEAPTLRRRLETGALFGKNEVLEILRGIAKGLDAMEAAGLVCPRLDSGDILLAADGPRPVPFFLPLPGSWLASTPADMTVAIVSAMPNGSAAALAPTASELLGGLRAGAVFRPLAGLDAAGNNLLRDAMQGTFQGSARELVEKLASSIPAELRQAAHTPPLVSPPRMTKPAPLPVTAAKVPSGQKRRVPALVMVAVVFLVLAGALSLWLAPRLLRTLTVLNSRPEATTDSSAAPTSSTGQSAAPSETPALSETPAATPTPTPTPRDRLADALDDAAAASDRGDYVRALDQLELAASLAADLSGVLQRTEMVAALLRSDAFAMTPAKFAELRPGLEAAAGRGVLSAQMLMGENLRARSPSASLAWFTQAASLGQTEAMTQCGLMLASGAGVPAPDLPAAVDWFRKGAAGGDTDAMVALADCLMRGKGTPQNLTEALDLLRNAAAFQHPAGLVLLAQLTKTGVPGVLPPDLNEAFRLFSAAAGRGSLEGQANVGIFHVNGWGTPKNPARAMELWEEGARLGDPTSMLFYARALEGGLTGKPDPAMAREFYIRAAKKGNADAREWCRKNGIQP